MKEKGYNIPFLRIAGKPAGDADVKYYESLLEFVKENGLHDKVSFEGFLADENMPVFFSNIDVLFLPYRGSNSGSSSGPAKWAMSFGVPIIASDIDTFIDLEAGWNCLKFEDGNYTDLSEKVVLFCSDENLRKKLFSGMIEISKRTSPKKIVNEFLVFFETLK